MANGNGEVAGVTPAKGVGRGPSYPAMGLEEAVKRAQQFWTAEKRGAAPIAAAVKHWGYSETSSTGKTAVAALIHFGLLEDQGARDMRTVKLTALALDILLDAPDAPGRVKALQAAVRVPRLYADVLGKWPACELPSDQTLRFYLLRERGFNDGAVDGFIKDLRASIAFSKLDETTADPVESHAAPEPEPEVSMRTSTTESDASVRAAPAALAHLHWSSAESATSEREWLRGPLSKAASYRLIVSGDMGPKEIGKLIKLLEAQKLVLDDDAE